MSSAAERMRRMRERKDADIGVARVEYEETPTIEMLIALRFLPPSQADDKIAIGLALERLVAAVVAQVFPLTRHDTIAPILAPSESSDSTDGDPPPC